VQGLRAGH